MWLSLVKGRPFGDAAWQARTTKTLGLESAFRPTGRPPKPKPAVKSDQEARHKAHLSPVPFCSLHAPENPPQQEVLGAYAPSTSGTCRGVIRSSAATHLNREPVGNLAVGHPRRKREELRAVCLSRLGSG